MTKLPAVNPNRLISKFKKIGFCIDHQTGSHVILLNNSRCRITVPRHNKDLKKGTLKSIIKQSGLNRNQFIKLLKRGG